MKDVPVRNLSGVWKLLVGESDFGFLPPPKFRLDTVAHAGERIRIETHQIDGNGDNTVVRDLIVGAEPVEAMILGRARWISARWDAETLVMETRSTVSGNDRAIEDRWRIGPEGLTIRRIHRQPGGAGHQTLRFREQFPA